MPSAYYHEQRAVDCIVCSDDFMADGEGHQLDYSEHVLANSVELTRVGRAGPGRDRTGAMLKCRISWTDQGFSWEADPSC